MKTPTSKPSNLFLIGCLLLAGCRAAPPVGEQEQVARRLLSDLNRGAGQVSAVHAAGSADLRQHQPLPDFARTVGDLNRQVGRLQTARRTDARVSRSMAEMKTSLIYHLTGDKGQADVKIYLTRKRNRWILDGLRVGSNP